MEGNVYAVVEHRIVQAAINLVGRKPRVAILGRCRIDNYCYVVVLNICGTADETYVGTVCLTALVAGHRRCCRIDEGTGDVDHTAVLAAGVGAVETRVVVVVIPTAVFDDGYHQVGVAVVDEGGVEVYEVPFLCEIERTFIDFF